MVVFFYEYAYADVGEISHLLVQLMLIDLHFARFLVIG